MPSQLVSLICLAILAGSTVTLAQNTKEIPSPAPPLVAPVPEFADWTVTVKYPLPPKARRGTPTHHDWRLVEVHSRVAGKVKRDLITSREGIKSEKWFVESMLLWTTPEGEVAVTDLSAAPPLDAEDPNPSIAHGFPGVSWIRLEYYAGSVMFGKRRCYHYVTGGREAWIDVETLLPAAYLCDNVSYHFKFNAPPDSPLTMPPAYQKAWETLRKMRN